MKQQFIQFAEQAREQRLDGPHHDETQFPLIGYCFDNALVLHQILTQNGYKPTFMVGTTDRVADELTQNNIDLKTDIQTVEDLAGLVHFWVKCNGYLIDIASDTHKHLGEVLVTEENESYYTYENSAKYAKETLQDAMSRRCSYCGAQIKTCSH
jgi:hypothetical protein